jgi:septal ring factor EnvC (AmiA/AmiB activator)
VLELGARLCGCFDVCFTLQDAHYSEEALQREREALAKALERLADVQKELATSQKELITGQKALAEQQDKLAHFLESPFDEATATLQVKLFL